MGQIAHLSFHNAIYKKPLLNLGYVCESGDMERSSACFLSD